MKRIFFCALRSDSITPLMPSPGRPKIVSTPQSINFSTSTSPAVIRCSLEEPHKAPSGIDAPSPSPGLLRRQICDGQTKTERIFFRSIFRLTLRIVALCCDHRPKFIVLTPSPHRELVRGTYNDSPLGALAPTSWLRVRTRAFSAHPDSVPASSSAHHAFRFT